MKKLLSKIFKDGKFTTIAGVLLSGLAHNLFPNLPTEVYAIIDSVAGGLIVSKDPGGVIPPTYDPK